MDSIESLLKREITLVFLISLFLILGWVIFDNALYFGFFDESADAATSTINVTVTESFTFTVVSGSTVAFGNISSDTRYSTHETMFSIDTNSADGWNVTAGRDRVNAALVSDGNTSVNISDGGATGPDPLTGGVPSCSTATIWPNSNASRGLGFTVFSASAATTIKDSCWGTGGNNISVLNKYAAFPTSASALKIIRNANNDTTTQRFTVGYLLEIRSTQQATNYTGDIVYTGTAAP